MQEADSSFSHIESPASGSRLPKGRQVITGWVMPKPGGHIVDVRANIGNQTFPGVHGLPRADLAAHFQTGKAFALAEFYIVVDIETGPVEIVLEALEISGQWQVFDILRFEIDAEQPPVDYPVPSGPLRWHEYGRALEKLLRNQRQFPDRTGVDLASELANAIPYPRDLRHPHLPFHGVMFRCQVP